jgi:hypothetical protein
MLLKLIHFLVFIIHSFTIMIKRLERQLKIARKAAM